MRKHQLTDLQITEVSLVDKPSNPGALLALKKRDDPKEEPMPQQVKKKWAARMQDRLEAISKRDDDVAKADIIRQVRKKAQKRAFERGTSPDLEESAIWQQLFSSPGVGVGYDLHPLQKRDGATWAPTEAEAKIEELALRIQRRDGLTFPAAVSKALDQQPELYGQYCREKERGEVFPGCEEAPLYKGAGFLSYAEQEEIRKRRKRKEDLGGAAHPGTAYGGTNDPLDEEDEAEDEAEDQAEDAAEAKRKRRKVDANASGDSDGAHRVRGLKRKRRKASDQDGVSRIRGKQDDGEDDGECPECGEPVPGDARFCPSCGASLQGAA